MKKPHLVIFVEMGGVPTKGGCSACKGLLFTTGADAGAAQEHHSKLEKLFRDHFRKIHMRGGGVEGALGGVPSPTAL